MEDFIIVGDSGSTTIKIDKKSIKAIQARRTSKSIKTIEIKYD